MVGGNEASPVTYFLTKFLTFIDGVFIVADFFFGGGVFVKLNKTGGLDWSVSPPPFHF